MFLFDVNSHHFVTHSLHLPDSQCELYASTVQNIA